MVEPRRPVEVTLERSLPDPARDAVLTVRVSAAVPDTPEGLEEEVKRLHAALDRAAETIAPGTTRPPRADRSLGELIEAYRPRQPELVDLLRDEGELTPTEFDALRRYLESAGGSRPTPAVVPVTDRPIAAAPLEADRTPTTPRPIPELLQVYQIVSLKQAGAVRARRQISFEEYMALKRHFAAMTPDQPPA